MIGQSISHYRILRRLGAGGMGEVYEAQDTNLRRNVALKVLPRYLAAKPDLLERFKREARAVAALNHPNIVTIHSVEQSDETHFITMEMVEGRPLNELIPREGFELERFFALGIPLTDALVAAHARGIGHRDLKPSNVMVNEQGRVKVIDFGLAMLFHRDTEVTDPEAPTVHQTMAGQVLGTPAYMSPEQIEGRKVDHRTDVFALGVLLCEMATGRRPFHGDTGMSVMASILRDVPPSLTELKPGLPEHLGRIVRRCLQKNPDERYQSALDVRHELNELADETRTARPPASKSAGILPQVGPPIGAVPNNLPVQLTSFVGRERETTEVSGLLLGTAGGRNSGLRLLTLTGSGGTGKTRLALQVAACLVERFPDGVWLVELAALSDPSLVPQSVVSALGLINTGGIPPLELLARHLASKYTLLLLDNCEHLVAACAELTDSLLRTGPRLQILATSREALRLAGETVWPVPTLSVPALIDGSRENRAVESLEQYEAIRLFVERARVVAPAFSLTEKNAAAVVQLCHRLDGIPLAIELAAARMRLLPVEQLLDRVQDRFRLLTGGSRAALPRQQTLRALVDWSYDLLSEEERMLFDRLSVFAGGWTLEAAEQVCADDEPDGIPEAAGSTHALRPEDVLDLLGHLLEKSMVVADRSADDSVRHRLLETLRQYGQQKLEGRGKLAGDALRTRHATYFVSLGEQAASGIHGPDQGKWLERIECEQDNVRAALEWGKAADADRDRVELVLRLAASLHVAWMRRGHGREARQHFETLLSHRNGQHPTRERAHLLVVTGSVAMWQDGDNPAAWGLLIEGLSLAEEIADTQTIAEAHQHLGQLLYNRGDLVEARRHQEESLRLSRVNGDVLGIRISLENLADLANDERNPVRASELYEEALCQARQSGDHHGIASVLQSMGLLAHATGKTGRAEELIGEALSIMQRIGCLHCSTRYLGDLALVAGASGEPEKVVKLLGAADALRERTGIVAPASSAGKMAQTLTSARFQLGDAAYATAWQLGRAMSLSQATTYALGPFVPVA